MDAGAKNIEIRVKNSGIDLLEVTDDGHGIKEEELETLCEAHTTSKISDFNDLASICTYGFRGEALNSLCSMSKVSVCSRHFDSPVGFKAEYDQNGILKQKTTTARQVGSTVSVVDLFSFLTVRRKDLEKNRKKEFGHLLTMVQGYGIIASNVRISCTNIVLGKKYVLISTNGNETMKENIRDVFTSKQLESVVEFKQEEPDASTLSDYNISESQKIDFKISGYVSSCEHGKGRSSSDRQFFFINDRPCDFPKLSRISNEIYRRFNRAQYPFLALNISIRNERILMMQSEQYLIATVHFSLHRLYSDLASNCPSIGPVISKTVNVVEKNNDESDVSQRKRPMDPNNSTGPVVMIQHHEPPSKQMKLGHYLQQNLNSFVKDIGESQKMGAIKDSPTESVASNRQEEKTEVAESTEESTVTTCNDVESCCSSPVDDLEKPKSRSPKFPDSIRSDLDSSSDSCQIEPPLNHQESSSSGTWRNNRKLKLDMNALERRLKSLRNADLPLDQMLIPRNFFAKITTADSSKAENELSRSLRKTDFEEMTVLGQFNLGFIITRLKDDLFIVDQHASDEKHTFEKLQCTAVVQKQKLLEPKDAGLTPIGESVVMDNLEIFRKNGFDFVVNQKNSAGQRVTLAAVPVLQGWNFDIQDIEELVAVLTDFPGRMYRPGRVRKIFASRACRTSVMIGTPLKISKMTQSTVIILEQSRGCLSSFDKLQPYWEVLCSGFLEQAHESYHALQITRATL